MTKPEAKTLGQELSIALLQALTITQELIRFVGRWLLIPASEAKDVLIDRL